MTADIVTDLAKNNMVIVSGMAMGVDAAAHTAAINTKGLTIAVLGCGVDCPYPRENESLYEKIIDSNGLIISEYPLGMPANQGTFPARNRIIAGLSLGVLITEAAVDSGSLITAEYAKKQEKPIFAVPGPITSQVSKGSYKLIKEGAIMVSSGKDIISELGIKNKLRNKDIADKFQNLSKDEMKIISALENESKLIDEISTETKIPVAKLAIILSGMELSGIIKNSSGKWSIA